MVPVGLLTLADGTIFTLVIRIILKLKGVGLIFLDEILHPSHSPPLTMAEGC